MIIFVTADNVRHHVTQIVQDYLAGVVTNNYLKFRIIWNSDLDKLAYVILKNNVLFELTP